MPTQDPERWRALNAELDRLLELDAPGRAAHLAAVRARDASLAAELEGLLAEHEAMRGAGFLEQGAASLLPTATNAPGNVPPPFGAAGPQPLAPGTVFGPYRIAGVIGRGGMGIVYEADEIESGRRVALKVLQDRLGDVREREVFEREGRLAASIAHEHCVFVFGAAEIDGAPTIAMERMAGTLADRLAERRGPLAPAEAVDAALQLAAGLQAAATVGILHRDVKPSNCFVDAGGVVKIGDFGISRSLRPTDETALTVRGQVAATPAYASPEQLRGATLDARADIYSLGVTLYELLTARRPFDRPDLMALLMAVANDRPVAPHVANPAVPKGLSDVVLRCLAKEPARRYASYDALVNALEPYASAAPTPATAGRRLLAGVTDHLLLAVAGLPLLAMWFRGGALDVPVSSAWLQQFVSLLPPLLYYGISEGIWSASPGKMLLSLRVSDVGGRPATGGRVVARAMLFVLTSWTAGALWLALVPSVDGRLAITPQWWQGLASTTLHYGLVALLFSTARRRNGYAGVHDLVFGVRVVERRALMATSQAGRHFPERTVSPPSIGRVGAFEVWRDAIPGMPAHWRRGFDPRLCRPVWIRQMPPGTPPVAPQRASITRATRLRWLAGCRTADDAWDVFEHVEGSPLTSAAADLGRWAQVRRWLLDLARELAASTAEDPAPPRRVDRVWVVPGGHAKLVDDPVVDAAAPPAITDAEFLRDLARTARARDDAPWPVSAEALLARLRERPAPDAAAIVPDLERLATTRAEVTRPLRAAALLLPVAFPIFMTILMSGAMLMLASQAAKLTPDERIAALALQRLWAASRGQETLSAEDRDGLEEALATRYRPVLADGQLFSPNKLMLGLSAEHRALAARILARRPPGQGRTDALTRPAVRRVESMGTSMKPPPLGEFVPMLLAVGLLFVAAASIVTAIAFRGGVLRVLGFEYVTADGRPATRLRVLARTLLAWSPLLVAIGALAAGAAFGTQVSPATFALTVGLGVAVLTAGAAWAIGHPSRGPADRVAGTWIVPR